MATAQLVTCGDASFANMEGSKSQCGVTVFLTHDPRLSGMVNFSSDIWFIGRAAQSNIWFGALLRLRHIQCQKLLRRLSGSDLFWLRCGLLSRAHFRVRTVEMDSLHRSIVTLSDFFNLCQAVKSDKGTGSAKRLRIVTAMLRQVFCGAQGATLAFVTTATMLADALTKPLVHCPSLLAAMNARRYVFVTSESSTEDRTNLRAPSEPAPTLKMAIRSQMIRSAASQSGRYGPSTC